MAVVNARIRDASHQFFVDGADLRAEVPERGLTARFDHAGAHIASAHDDAATPIALRTTRVGRAASATPIVAAAPALGDCQEGKADPEGHCIPRLEYARGGLTEWWEAGAGGFEQGWVLTERPEGSGAVRIDIEVGNADATVEGGSVHLHGDDGATLIVSRLAAWDARGDDVPWPGSSRISSAQPWPPRATRTGTATLTCWCGAARPHRWHTCSRGRPRASRWCRPPPSTTRAPSMARAT
jgi:hypothetical protein